MDELIKDYAADVQFPDTGPASILHMLRTRDEIEDLLVSGQLRSPELLRRADMILLSTAQSFVEGIHSRLDLKKLRKDEALSVDRWWWYLDRLEHVVQAVLPNWGYAGNWMFMTGYAEDTELSTLSDFVAEHFPELLRDDRARSLGS